MTAAFPLVEVRSVTDRVTTWNRQDGTRDSIKYIDVSAVSREVLAIVDFANHTIGTAPSRAQKIVRANDTLVATIRPGLRRVALVPAELDASIASTAFCVLRPAPGKIDPLFLFYAAISNSFVGALEELQTGASYPAVRDKDVLEQTIPLPPLSEQCKIARALSALRRSLLCESNALKLAQDAKRAAMASLFTRGLSGTAQKETDFGPVPEGWDEVILESVATIQTGVAKGRKFANADVIEVPYLRVANVQDGHLDLSQMKTIRIRRGELDRYRLQDGDVVLTEGGDFDKLGRGFIWRGELDICVHQNHVFAVRPESSRLLPDFFAYLAQSTYGKAYFLQVAHKTTNLACINTTKLKAFPVILPPLDEQQGIVAILRALDRKIDLHRRKRGVLEEIFEALLHKLMAGEIRADELGLTALGAGPPHKLESTV